MRTVELTTVAQPVEDLLELADAEGVLLRLPNGKVFLLTSVTDAVLTNCLDYGPNFHIHKDKAS